MKALFKFIFIPLLFLFSFLIFTSKEGVYNLIERELAKNNVVVSNEIRSESLLGLKVQNADIYYDGLNVAFIDRVDFSTLLFFNKLSVKNIRISKSFENMLPSRIDNLNITYSVLKFNSIDLSSNGDFGEFAGEVLLFDRKIVGELKPSETMKSKYSNILNQFKLVEGKYIYEQSF